MKPYQAFIRGELDTQTAARIFGCLAIAWFVVWTAIPWFFMPSPGKEDVLETLLLGHEWVLGSTKHPPLPFWFLEIMFGIFKNPVIASAVSGQLFVLLGLWSIWRLSRYYLSESLALFVVLITMSYRYFSIGSVNFTTAVPPVSLWCLTIFLMFRTLRYQRLRDWISVGIVLGLGLLCKYSFGILVITAILYLCWEPQLRPHWKKPGPWLAAFIAFLIFLPHMVWTINNHFPTIQYATHCLSAQTTPLDHLTSPTLFAGSQLFIVLPVLIPLIPLLGFVWQVRWNSNLAETADPTQSLRDRNFLTFMIFVPFAIQLLIFAIGGRMKPTYGSPLWTLTGLWFVVVFQRRENIKAIRNASVMALGIMAITVISFCVNCQCFYWVSRDPNQIHYPGPGLAVALDSAWKQRFDSPCPYLSGDWVMAGSAALYMKHRPSVLCYYYGLDDDQTPVGRYASDEDLLRKGGMIVWPIPKGKTLYVPDYLKRYPTAEISPGIVSIPYRTRYKLAPLRMRYAIVPPKAISKAGD